jgi:hypothetical protein
MHSSRTGRVALAALLLAPALLFADYTYEETTQITGGSMLQMIKMAAALNSQARKAGDPVVSTVYIKGNRMAKVSPDAIEIIDLDKETMTNIDTVKHTYTVMTFEQIREQAEKAMQEAQKHSAQQPASAPQQNPNDVKMSFDVKVRNTGAEKQVSGLSSHEAILTMLMTATDQKTQQSGAMAITNDMWLVPEIPGYDQVKEFYRKFGEEMGKMAPDMGIDMSRMLAQNPGATQALSDMGKQIETIKGVPIMQIMRMGSTTDGKPLPAASEAPLPPDNSPAMPSGSDVAKQGMASALNSKLGKFGFGGFGKKKNDDQQAANPTPAAPQPTSAVLMETQTTVSNFSSDTVDASHFVIPAGYKQLQPQMR